MGYISAAAVTVVIVAEFAAWRRKNRRDVDRVGFMPWREVSFAALAVAFLSAALALHAAL